MPPRRYRVVLERVEGFPELPLPARATPGSACFDLCSAESVHLSRDAVTLVRTGLRMRAPPGTFLEVRPRSGLAAKGVVMANAPGTIDRDYSGEVRVPLLCLFPTGYDIHPGDRIAQVRVVLDHRTELRVGKVSPVEGRSGGFGSTGR